MAFLLCFVKKASASDRGVFDKRTCFLEVVSRLLSSALAISRIVNTRDLTRASFVFRIYRHVQLMIQNVRYKFGAGLNSMGTPRTTDFESGRTLWMLQLI